MTWRAPCRSRSTSRRRPTPLSRVTADGSMSAWSMAKAVVVRALVDGRIGLWVSPIDGSGFHEIGPSEGEIEAFAIAADGTVISREGPPRDAIARAEEAERDTGILFDARVDLAQPLYRGASINGRPSTQRFSGDWFDRVPLLEDTPRAVVARDASGTSERPANDAERALLKPAPGPDIPESLRGILRQRGVCVAASGCPNDAERIRRMRARRRSTASATPISGAACWPLASIFPGLSTRSTISPPIPATRPIPARR